ncbi:Peroxisomal membrane associated protein, partial [Lachnellula suecica]
KMVKVGDSIPSIPLVEGAPDKQVDLSTELKNGILIGVPAAFSPTCSDDHIPGFIKHPKLSSAGTVFVVSVNDAFVMNAWGKSLDADKKSGIRFLGDPSGAFIRALDLEFPAAPFLGTNRSKRFAAVIKDGKFESISVEPDAIGHEVSTAQKVLG